MSVSKKNSGNILINIFAGSGMGLLVGIIIGLSVSPVVKVILGALASMLAAFLGLQPGGNAEAAVPEDKSDNMLSKLQQNSLKAGSFGFACVFAIFLGLFIRNQNVFERPLESQIAEWDSAGYDLDYARQLIVLEKFGINPETKEISFGDLQKTKTGALYAKKGEKDICSAIDPERFKDVAEVLKSYRRQESDTMLPELADVLERLEISESEKLELMNAIKEVICE